MHWSDNTGWSAAPAAPAPRATPSLHPVPLPAATPPDPAGEAANLFRGLAFGLPLSLALWAGIALIVWGVWP